MTWAFILNDKLAPQVKNVHIHHYTIDVLLATTRFAMCGVTVKIETLCTTFFCRRLRDYWSYQHRVFRRV